MKEHRYEAVIEMHTLNGTNTTTFIIHKHRYETLMKLEKRIFSRCEDS